jgi:hypothetical protein
MKNEINQNGESYKAQSIRSLLILLSLEVNPYRFHPLCFQKSELFKLALSEDLVSY